jgi:glycosyltransferase involved in cell wall biosynthesis
MESYPTKLFEYMAVGLPVITSNFPLYQQTIEGNGCGLCVDPFDTEKLKTAILEIHNDVKKSELMVENGKKAVREKYDWKSQIPLLMGVYKRLLE